MRVTNIGRATTVLVGIMIMTILLCCSSQVQAAQEADYTYTITDGKAQITGYSGSGGVVTIPGTLGGTPVTSIGVKAFYGCSGLTTIDIPQGLTSIDYCAFVYCSGLTSIKFNSATTTIYDDENTIPDTTKIIGNAQSTAKDYATKYNRKFEVIGTTPNPDTSGMTEIKPISSTVVPDKVWTIKLKGIVNEASIEDKIYITNSQGIKQATTCTVTTDNEKGLSQISVIPDKNYDPDDYILWVRDIKSVKGNILKNQVYLKFTSAPLLKKPVIYLYPTKEQQVSVKLNFNGNFTCTYPEYKNGWEVIAHPDGKLENLEDNKEYSYLFWEGILNNNRWDMTKGFVVAGKDTKDFLKDKLSLMGLTPKEYNDFIAYWLPKMQDNQYNLITFANEEYKQRVHLSIEPNPDSVLRVFMIYKPITEKFDIPSQQLTTFNRTGFSVVEWGGTEIYKGN